VDHERKEPLKENGEKRAYAKGVLQSSERLWEQYAGGVGKVDYRTTQDNTELTDRQSGKAGWKTRDRTTSNYKGCELCV